MLDASALSQLSSLKEQFQEDKETLSGQVSGSPGRYGFVAPASGERYFLPPDEMKRVLPGDTIEFTLLTLDERTQAQVESVLDSPLDTFVGKVNERKNRRFVLADAPGLQRAFNLTRKSADGCKPGQWVSCKVKRHPFENGQALAETLAVLGDDDTPFLEHQIAQARFGVRTEFPDTVRQQLAELPEQPPAAAVADYEDATDLPLVTIDGASTRDMDDAVLVESESDGWQVTLAIADPGAWITPDSPIDLEARARYTSRYLPGRTLHMLPARLAEDLCSLQAGEKRPALLLSTFVDARTGTASDVRLRFAMVRSHARLTYTEVAAFFGDGSSSDSIQAAGVETPLRQLQALSTRLYQYRLEQYRVMPERPDYRLHLNARGHIEHIVVEERNAAQQAIEEVMLLANRITAEWLAARKTGLFLQHAGFREDQADRVRAVLDTARADLDLAWSLPQDLSDFQAMRPILQQLDRTTQRPLARMVSRFYQKAALSTQPGPHWGLGFDQYTTVTSPIRKYLDLFIHRQIKALWRGQTPISAAPDTLAHMQVEQGRVRALGNFTEQWLKLIHVQNRVGETLTGEVQGVTPNGFSVSLDAFGMQGFVSLRSRNDQQAEFDAARQTHHLQAGSITLGQKVRLRLDGIDLERQNLQLSWLPD